jgi:predicted nucleic acid-binding protein
VTEGELRHGLAKKPEATALREAVASFLRHVEVLPWDSAAAAALSKTGCGSHHDGCELDPRGSCS